MLFSFKSILSLARLNASEIISFITLESLIFSKSFFDRFSLAIDEIDLDEFLEKRCNEELSRKKYNNQLIIPTSRSVDYITMTTRFERKESKSSIFIRSYRTRNSN